MSYLDSTNYELPYQSGSATSEDAARAAAKFVGQQGQAVYRYVEAWGDRGATQKDIARGLQLGRPSVAARVHALEHTGRLVKLTSRREGCAVYRTEA